MDILDLESLKKKFEIIESVGVLHHMEDPYKGFNNLCDVLKPSGLIMIGLYSKMARRHIERIRLKIKKLNLKTTEKNIKNYREKIINYNEDDYNFIKNSTDFYTLSDLRDLLFHVQEYRFSIPEIVNYLNKLNLNFCGFENRNVINLFKKTYLNEHDLYNLDKWNEFEINNPRIFAGMYQFWSQKN